VPHETDKHGTERTTTVNDTASMSWHLFLKLLKPQQEVGRDRLRFAQPRRPGRGWAAQRFGQPPLGHRPGQAAADKSPGHPSVAARVAQR
jgi:hypothetical protein